MGIRSLREIRIGALTQLHLDVTEHAYLGIGEEFRTVEYDAWRAQPSLASRAEAVASSGVAIEKELVRVRALDDATYATETLHLPLSYWNPAPVEIGPHARARGIEGRQWYSRPTSTFGNPHAGMGGFDWFWVGKKERPPQETLDRILGFHLSTSSLAAKWAALDGLSTVLEWGRRISMTIIDAESNARLDGDVTPALIYESALAPNGVVHACRSDPEDVWLFLPSQDVKEYRRRKYEVRAVRVVDALGFAANVKLLDVPPLYEPVSASW